MHSINHDVFDEAMSKDRIYAECNAVAVREGDYHSSLDPIRFLSAICESYEEAESYLERNDNHWYDNLAVRYKEPKKASSKTAKLTERYNEAYNKALALDRHFHFENAKSEFIGCKECGSKLARTHLRSNRCPLCGKDLRPQTTLDKIKTLYDKANALDKQVKESIKNDSKTNYKLKWLVKYEFHC